MKPVLTCGPGLLIGLPTLGRPVSLEWALQYKGMNPPINYSVNAMVVYGKPVDVAREEICQEALTKGHKYVFFLGDDVIPPFATLKQLIFRAEQDPELGVVGGVYCSKSEPPAPLVFRNNGVGTYWDWKVGEYFDVTGLGMDCTLIRTEVLSKLKKPWFKTVDDDDFKDAINQAEQWTEDLYFCKKVLEETDFKIYCDSSIVCKHVDVYGNKIYSLPSESLPLRKFNGTKDKKAIDIGCGPIDRTEQFPDYDLVRVDIRDEVNPDYRCDVRLLPFDNKSFDLVFSSHVLEHFGRGEYMAVLTEWIRVMKDDGLLVLILPNIEWAMNEMVTKKKADIKLNDALNVFYGAQTNDFDYHYNAFWPDRIQEILGSLGFKHVNFEHQGYNMIIRALREEPVIEAPKVAPFKLIEGKKKEEVKEIKKNGNPKVRSKLKFSNRHAG